VKIVILSLKYRIILVIIGLLICGARIIEISAHSTADKGIISIARPTMPIYESSQKAIICWNGTHEILVLSTDVYAEEKTFAFEILPLPGIPEIKKCNESVFTKLKSTIDKYWRYPVAKSEGLGAPAAASSTSIGISIIFNEKIDIHNITVVKATNSTDLMLWLNKTIRDFGMEPTNYPNLDTTTNDYISRGIQYFVIDIIDLTNTAKSAEPLMYIFNSTCAYYPLKITSLISGTTDILFFMITNYDIMDEHDAKEPLGLYGTVTVHHWNERSINLSRLYLNHIYQRGSNIYIPSTEIKAVNESLYDLFASEKNVQVNVLEYYGTTKINNDLILKDYTVSYKTTKSIEYNVPVLAVVTILPFGGMLVLLLIAIRYIGDGRFLK
jgi:hypothetical protein